MSLLAALEQVPDRRQASGRRYGQAPLLLVLLLGRLSGCSSFRALAAFAHRHHAPFRRRLGLRAAPTYLTFWRLVQGVDWVALEAAFNRWAAARLPTAQHVAVDGKALRSSVQEPFGGGQDFVASVALYCQQRGLVLAQASYHNGQQSEAHVVEQLLADWLPGGCVVTADALHCRKKRSSSSTSAVATTSSP